MTIDLKVAVLVPEQRVNELCLEMNRESVETKVLAELDSGDYVGSLGFDLPGIALVWLGLKFAGGFATSVVTGILANRIYDHFRNARSGTKNTPSQIVLRAENGEELNIQLNEPFPLSTVENFIERARS